MAATEAAVRVIHLAASRTLSFWLKTRASTTKTIFRALLRYSSLPLRSLTCPGKSTTLTVDSASFSPAEILQSSSFGITEVTVPGGAFPNCNCRTEAEWSEGARERGGWVNVRTRT